MRNPERVSLLPLLTGLVLLLALTLIGSMRFNSAEQREILDRTGNQLSAHASTAAAMVTVWTGVQRDAVAEMARYDMLRLLASEIAETDLPAALLRELGESPWTGQEHGRHSGLDARDRMTKLCEVLESSRYAFGKDVFVDGFTYFNAQERQVLVPPSCGSMPQS